MDFKKHFNLSEQILYVNTPGNGLLPKETLAWRRNWDETFFDIHTDLRDKQADFLSEVKASISTLFNTNSENTFLTPNFSFGYNTLIERLPTDFEFLVLADEYPSLQYPLINRRLSFQEVPVSINVEERILEAIETQRPDVFVFSVVQYISGLKIDLGFIRQLKKTFPDMWIIADATQYLGTEPFDFKASGIDALACSGYKWLLSGFGNGFICLSNGLADFLNEMLKDIPRPKAAMWQTKSLLGTFFEPGHQDTLAHGTLQHSLKFLERMDLREVGAHLEEVRNEAYELLDERDLLLYICKRANTSSLINIQIDPALYPNLLQSGIKCFPRGTGIRIGLHLYNDKEDVHRLIEIIESLR